MILTIVRHVALLSCSGKDLDLADARTLCRRQSMQISHVGRRADWLYEIRNAILASRNRPLCGKKSPRGRMALDAHSNISSRKMSTLRPRY